MCIGNTIDDFLYALLPLSLSLVRDLKKGASWTEVARTPYFLRIILQTPLPHLLLSLARKLLALGTKRQA